MYKIIYCLILLLSFNFIAYAKNNTFSKSWWFKQPKGWYWYNQDNKTKKKIVKRKIKTKKVKEVSASQQLKEFRQYVDEIKARAILNPTYKNVKKWLEVNKAILNRSKNFALVSRAVLYSNPDLDTNKNFPISQVGVNIRRNQEAFKIRKALLKISNKAGLIVFFSEYCPYCQKELQAINQFNMDYPFFTVFLMSKEYEACNNLKVGKFFVYPKNIRCQYGKNLSASLNVNFYPTTYIGIPSQNKYFLLGEGLLTEADIIDRLLVIGNYNKILTDNDLPLIYRKIKNKMQNINKLLLEYKKEQELEKKKLNNIQEMQVFNKE